MWYLIEPFTVSNNAIHISYYMFVEEKKGRKKETKEERKGGGRKEIKIPLKISIKLKSQGC